MSNALLEQMSCGLGAVMPRVGGCEEALTGHGGVPAGILYPTGDMSALAAGMRAMFESASNRVHFGERARRIIVELFSADIGAEHIESYYRFLIERARAGKE